MLYGHSPNNSIVDGNSSVDVNNDALEDTAAHSVECSTTSSEHESMTHSYDISSDDDGNIAREKRYMKKSMQFPSYRVTGRMDTKVVHESDSSSLYYSRPEKIYKSDHSSQDGDVSSLSVAGSSSVAEPYHVVQQSKNVLLVRGFHMKHSTYIRIKDQRYAGSYTSSEYSIEFEFP